MSQLWRRAAESGSVPDPAELEAASALVDIRGLEIDADRRVRLQRPGQQIDLGALGRGAAADRCIELYREHGIRHGLIDFGGNVSVLGGKPGGRAWRVGIQAPGRKRGEYFGYLEVENGAIVTSGNYEHAYQIGGQRYSQIIDPRTGHPVDSDILSVTVLHPSSLYADALATAFMVMGAERAIALAQELKLDVLLVTAGGHTFTPGMRRVFRERSSAR